MFDFTVLQLQIRIAAGHQHAEFFGRARQLVGHQVDAGERITEVIAHDHDSPQELSRFIVSSHVHLHDAQVALGNDIGALQRLGNRTGNADRQAVDNNDRAQRGQDNSHQCDLQRQVICWHIDSPWKRLIARPLMAGFSIFIRH